MQQSSGFFNSMWGEADLLRRAVMQQEAQAGGGMLGVGLAVQQGDVNQQHGYSAVRCSARHAAGMP